MWNVLFEWEINERSYLEHGEMEKIHTHVPHSLTMSLIAWFRPTCSYLAANVQSFYPLPSLVPSIPLSFPPPSPSSFRVFLFPPLPPSSSRIVRLVFVIKTWWKCWNWAVWTANSSARKAGKWWRGHSLPQWLSSISRRTSSWPSTWPTSIICRCSPPPPPTNSSREPEPWATTSTITAPYTAPPSITREDKEISCAQQICQ